MVYVDDLLITSLSEKLIADTKKDLSEEFEITDLGQVNYFLGIKYGKGSSDFSMKLSQTAYIKKILDLFGMNPARSVSTPMTPEYAAECNIHRSQSKEEYSGVKQVR